MKIKLLKRLLKELSSNLTFRVDTKVNVIVFSSFCHVQTLPVYGEYEFMCCTCPTIDTLNSLNRDEILRIILQDALHYYIVFYPGRIEKRCQQRQKRIKNSKIISRKILNNVTYTWNTSNLIKIKKFNN